MSRHVHDLDPAGCPECASGLPCVDRVFLADRPRRSTSAMIRHVADVDVDHVGIAIPVDVASELKHGNDEVVIRILRAAQAEVAARAKRLTPQTRRIS